MMLTTMLVESESFIYTHVCACLLTGNIFYTTPIFVQHFSSVLLHPPLPPPLPQVVAVVSSQVQKDGQTVNFLAQETSEVLQVYLYMYIVTKLQNFVVL